jgi:trehalose synthase
LTRIEVRPRSISALQPVLGSERLAELRRLGKQMHGLLAGRRLITINSTPSGGGVAEMLTTVLGYLRGSGLDVNWYVLRGNAPFFAVTKRIHNGLHGSSGDGGDLGDTERVVYESVHVNARESVRAVVRPGDVVIVHDPQPLGLARAARDADGVVVWRCHVGTDVPNDYSSRSWAFLQPYLEELAGYVFSRAEYVPEFLDSGRVTIIPPTVDPLSPKNQDMSAADVRRAIVRLGLVGGVPDTAPVTFSRQHGPPGRILRVPDILQSGSPPPPDAPLVVQISRWDLLKDMAGVMTALADSTLMDTGAHLSLIGPAVTGYADDPEGVAVLRQCMDLWRSLPHTARERIHLACLPMSDLEENAAMVNAIQRHASIITQKSVAEGFGLTVLEAMLKGRPVVGSRVGGIQEQIVHGESGVLVDPYDLPAFARAVGGLLSEPGEAVRIGQAARARAVDVFLVDRHLALWAGLLTRLLK